MTFCLPIVSSTDILTTQCNLVESQRFDVSLNFVDQTLLSSKCFSTKRRGPKNNSAAAYVAEVEIVAVGIKMRFFSNYLV